MDTAVFRYTRAVGQRLHCSRTTRGQLLAGLRQEIREAFPAGICSRKELVEHFGPPEEVARELQQAVSPEEMEQYFKRQRLRLSLLFLGCIAAALLFFLYMLWLQTIPFPVNESDFFIS